MAGLRGILVTSALCFIYSHLNSHLCAALPQQETSISRISPPPGSCLLPDPPIHGEYTSPSCKPGDPNPVCNNVPGNVAPSGWTIKYRCFRGYDISSEGPKFSVCDNGVWDNPIDCVRLCPRLRSSTMDIVCKYKDREVNCDDPMKPNTTAEIGCKPNYSVQRLEYSILICGYSNGQWNHVLPECFSECGISQMTSNKPLILNGMKTNHGDYPWLASIYRQNESLLWSYICGGTLISPYSVLTAAHCVTTPEAELLNHTSIKIGLGKYFSDYYINENSSVIANVIKIIIPKRYTGHPTAYARDIALLDLSASVPVNNYIMPACVDWPRSRVFKNGTILEEGYVSGWGATETQKKSDEVRSTKLKYIEQTECVKKVRGAFQRFVLVDKFCAEAGNGTGGQVSEGDSGGGMTVVVEGVHYVVGVVSTRLSEEQPFSIFTDLSEHLLWLETEKSHLEVLHRSELNKDPDEDNRGESTEAPEKKDGKGEGESSTEKENGIVIRNNCKQASGATWPCKLMKDCEKAVEDFKNGISPEVCGLEGRHYPKVCCQPYEESKYFKSKEMCKKYSESVYRKIGSTKIDTCALVEPLVSNGINTQPREFPHMAHIGFGEENSIEWQCGGSLVSEKYVLSAAQCSNKRPYGFAKWVRLGDYDIESSEDEEKGAAKAVLYKIIERINHPQFNISSKTNMPINDIALFKLDRNVDFNEFIRPACLHNELQFTKTYAVVTGWGRTAWGGKTSKILQKANLTITSRKQCNEEYYDAFGSDLGDASSAPVFCAGNVENGKDTCKGDAGGPLQLRLKEPYCMYSIVGIASFGRICGGNYPSVYTRVSYFVPWLETILWP